MALNQVYCEVLGLGPDADQEEIKRAYRVLVRKNHPDLFPAEERPEQEARMMRINQAYERLLRDLNQDGNRDSDQRVAGWDYELHRKDPVLSGERDVGGHKDPAYAYYKQGFIKYSAGAGGMHIQRRRRKLSPDSRGLETATEALKNFHAAHAYFQRVVDDYPGSIWARDASYRLYRIERFMAIYRRIQRNLKHRVKQPDDRAPAPPASAEA